MARPLLVTPELALVDPELRRAALRQLPAPLDCLAPRARPTHQSPRSFRLLVVASAVSVVLVSAMFGLPSRLAILSGLSASGATPATTWQSSRTATPAASAGPQGLPTVPELRWHPTRGAAFYDLVLLTAGVGPIRLRVDVDHVPAAALIERAGGRLPAGSFVWYVLPTIRVGHHTRLGGVSAVGLFTVQA